MFKEIKIMKKTLRYLLILIGLVSILSLGAQGLAKMPTASFRSTSTMVGSGSSLPLAANSDVMVTGSTIGSYAPAQISKPRREVGGGDDGWADDDVTPGQGDVAPELPGDLVPIGDVFWPLALFALAFAFVKWKRKRSNHSAN